MTILIVGATFDLHAHCVAWALGRHGIPSHILGLDCAPALPPPGQVRAIWARRACSAEGVAALAHMLDPTVDWIDDVDSMAAARGVALQLRIAASAGFVIPPTLISNDPQAIRQFFAQHGADVVALPSMAGEAELANDAPSTTAPAIYQRRGSRLFSVRVLACGATIVAVRLDADPRSSLNPEDAAHASPFRLAPDSAARITRFMRALRLRFACIDLAIDDNGDEIFHGLDTQGRFLFLDAACPEIGALGAVCGLLADAGGHQAPQRWPTHADYLASSAYQGLMRELALGMATRLAA